MIGATTSNKHLLLAAATTAALTSLAVSHFQLGRPTLFYVVIWLWSWTIVQQVLGNADSAYLLVSVLTAAFHAAFLAAISFVVFRLGSRRWSSRVTRLVLLGTTLAFICLLVFLGPAGETP